jgi:hypothetical protein
MIVRNRVKYCTKKFKVKSDLFRYVQKYEVGGVRNICWSWQLLCWRLEYQQLHFSTHLLPQIRNKFIFNVRLITKLFSNSDPGTLDWQEVPCTWRGVKLPHSPQRGLRFILDTKYLF